MQRNHVVHVVPALFGANGVFGGAERYALELARAMAKETPTTLVAFGDSPSRERVGDLEIRVLRNWMNFRRFKFDPFSPSLLRALKSADIIHYHQTHTMMASLALVYAHVSGKPIFTSHLGGSGYGLHRIMNLDRYFDEHLHISEFSKRTFAQRGRAHASVILGGVDTEKFKPSSDQPRDEVLYVGRLLPHKGVNYLVEAVDKATPLALVGRPWRHAQSFFDLLNSLAAGKNVSFHTDYSDAETIGAYQRAMCIVLPSVHETVTGEHYAIPELLGQTLLEGMACGAPAICTRVCSLPEVVEDGVSGFVVPPNDAAALGDRIRWLKEHPQEAKRMGIAARRRVLGHFSWSSVVRRCFEAYGISSAVTAAS